MLGMLRGLAEVAGVAMSSSSSRRPGPRNSMRLRSALNEIPGDRRLVVVPPPSNI
jgi:hypothetical protein